MDLRGAFICPSPEDILVSLFCFAWPFVTIAFIRKGGHSSVPVSAMLLVLGVALLGTWLGIMNALRGMALSGGGWASSAAGFAGSLRGLSVGAVAVIGVAIVMLLKRHRPVVDRVTVLIALAFIADTIGALLFLRFFSFPIAGLVFVGIGIAAAIAIASAVWLIAVVRGWTQSAPVPAAAPAIAVCIILLAGLVLYDSERYMQIAEHGVTRLP